MLKKICLFLAIALFSFSFSPLFGAKQSAVNQAAGTTDSPTFAGLSLGSGNISLTGSIASDGSRVTKGWFTDVESTNAPTVSGAAVYYSGGTDVSLADGGTGASLSDPGANTILGWDDTDNAINLLTIGTGLSYDHASHTLSSTGAMTYPEAGIPISTGSAWGTSLSETDGYIIYGASSAWTKGTALPNGITATTQSQADNSTKLATTAYVHNLVFSKSFVITNPSSASDSPLWRVPSAITIKAIHVLCMDGTNIIGQMWEYDSNGANGSTVDSSDITGTAGSNVDDDGTLSNPGIATGNYLGWKTTSVSGVVTKVIITYDYTID